MNFWRRASGRTPPPPFLCHEADTPRRTVVFRDPVLLCGVLYGLLWFDASGFLRIGLWAAFLHECGHVAACLAMLHEMPTLEVNMTGFCMRTRGKA